MEDIDVVNGSLAGLFEAEHEVDPCGEVLSDKVTLQRVGVHQGEESRVMLAPGGQTHVIHNLTILTSTKRETCRGKRRETSGEVMEESRLKYLQANFDGEEKL